MNAYLSMTGVVSQIQPGFSSEEDQGCSLVITLQTYYQGTVLFTLSGSTYVVDNATVHPGDQLTIFYDRNAPVVLSYPPTYRAVLIAKSQGYQFYLGEFSENLLSSDNALQLLIDANTRILLPNGQTFSGSVPGKTVLAEYQTSTRSIPAQAVPDRLIVFCN